MAKLSESKKVELLAQAVAANDAAAVRALYAEHGSFEFTARVLADACRKAGTDVVQALCENGATLNYEYTPTLARKYGCTIATSNRDSYPINYNQYLVAGRAEKIDNAVPGDVRRANLRVLWQHREAVGLMPQEVLYQALVWQDDDLVAELKELGVTTLTPYRAAMAAGKLPHNQLDSLGRYERCKISGAFNREPALVVDFLRGFGEVLGEPMHLFKSDITTYDFEKSKDVLISKLCSEPVFPAMIAHTDFAAVAKKADVLYAFVDEGNAAGLAWAMEQGWVKEKDEKTLLKYAQKMENVSAPVMALLLSRSKPAEEPVASLSLSAVPSAAELKKSWTTKKLEDGTLMITGYKGEALDVVIPDKIGKTPVTALGPDVFNPTASRLTREQVEVRENLRSVEVPGSFGVIPKNLFGCIYGYPHFQLRNLKRVVLGEGIHTLQWGAFMGCTGLEEVVLPSTLTTLEYGVFYSCVSLPAAHLPAGVTEIDNCAFYNCKSLKELTLPPSASVKDTTFTGCPGLQDENGMVIFGNILYNYYGTAQKVVVPEGITVIGDNAFCANTDTEEIILPASLTKIGYGAFSGCDALKRLDIPRGVTELPTSMLNRCKTLESVSIPDTVKIIQYEAFSGCAALTKVTLPEGLEEIGVWAFRSCTALTEIHIPASVRTIGNRFGEEFQYCDKLTIYAPAGSAAEEYANKFGYRFVAE